MLMTPNDSSQAYANRIGRVVDYLHDHLEDKLDLDVLAEVAAMSRWHWHRVYTAMQGETAAATVRRLRLARAADRLANSGASLGEIARRAGYTTVEAFGRAFKQSYGATPAAYRETGSHILFKAARRASDAAGFPVEIVNLPPMRCVAVAHRGSYMDQPGLRAVVRHRRSERAGIAQIADDRRLLRRSGCRRGRGPALGRLPCDRGRCAGAARRGGDGLARRHLCPAFLHGALYQPSMIRTDAPIGVGLL